MTTGHAIVAVIGGAAEFIGFGLVLRESSRLRHEELGHISRLRKLWGIVRETIENPAPQVIVAPAASAVSGTGHLDIKTFHEDAMDALRRRVDELEGRQTATQEQLASHTQEVRSRVEAVGADLNERFQQVQEKRRSDIARAISNERRGAGIFLLGVAFNLAANLIT